jgi:hypothetical protein
LKREKKDFKDLDVFIDGKKKKFRSSKSQKKRMTQKMLELLSKKFDEVYQSENNMAYQGPRLTHR